MRWGYGFLGLFLFSRLVGAAPDTTMTVAPSAVSGTTITAADENSRNNTITTAYNAHSHTDISQTANTLNVGDGTAGNKAVCGNAADAIDSCLRWNDTLDMWQTDVPVKGSYNQLLVVTGTSGLNTDALLVGTGAGGVVDDLITLAGTRPATYGDVSARAFNSGAIALTSGTATILTLDSERWDTDTIHSIAVSTSRLTATTAGKYQITGSIEFASGSSGQRLLEVLLNGATVIAAQSCEFNPTQDGNSVSQVVTCSVSTHYNLASTDYVELRVTQRVSATLNVNASANYSPEFEMVKVP